MPRRLSSALVGSSRALAGEPREWVVHDVPSPCVYLDGETARLPLRLPERRLSAAELSARLAAGDRRQGILFYRPSCPSCRACEAIRIDVGQFRPTRTQRRIFRRGEAEITTSIGRPDVSAERVALYNRHKLERGLSAGEGPVDEDMYRELLAASCVDTFELVYRHAGEIVAVAITDRAADSLSAVYCYFDPDFSRLSPGAYSILKQIELCHAWNLRYLYLGLHVRGCGPMRYKVGYLPHERLVGGAWRRFDSPA
jgi:leucyl-tRNA---protein transferase